MAWTLSIGGTTIVASTEGYFEPPTLAPFAAEILVKHPARSNYSIAFNLGRTQADLRIPIGFLIAESAIETYRDRMTSIVGLSGTLLIPKSSGQISIANCIVKAAPPREGYPCYAQDSSTGVLAARYHLSYDVEVVQLSP